MNIGLVGRVFAAVVSVGVGCATFAWAQTDQAKVVTERQDAMKGMGGALFGQIGKVVRGEDPVTAASEPAAKLDQLAQSLPRLFPNGSGREAAPATRARPEVWSDSTEFQEAAKRFAAETSKLADVAKRNDLEAIKAQFAATTRACGGCHEARPADGGKFRFPRS